MSDFDFNNLEDLKAEEKRLYDEYKAKLAELKKVQKENSDTDKCTQKYKLKKLVSNYA